MIKRLLYVVHRYPPYTGGSEYYVQAMAEESLKRGYEVTVFTDMHKGHLHGVRVTSNPEVIAEYARTNYNWKYRNESLVNKLLDLVAEIEIQNQ